MRVKIGCIGCIAILLLAAQASAAERLALVTTGTNPRATQAIDLATAELSGEAGIELVDRQSIRAVLEEQKLSLSGLVDSSQMIRVGQLAKADLFAVIDAGPSEGMGLVVFDTQSGLRLSDTAIEADPQKAAASIVAAIHAALTKDRALDNGTRIIGFLPVRNADLPREQDAFCDAVRLLLERQLTASPGIAVLERSRLEHVNQERQLPLAKGTGNLRASVVLIQLEISHHATGQGLNIVATLTQSGGVLDHVRASTDEDSPADLADKLQQRILDALKLQAIDHPFNRGEEARRFARDAQVFVHSGRFAAGASAAEAAYALSAVNQNRLTLSTALWASAWDHLTPGELNLAALQTQTFNPINPSADDANLALSLADRALAMQQKSLRIALAGTHNRQFFLDYTGGEERITLLEGFCSRWNMLQNPPPDSQPPFAQWRSAAMTYLLDYFDGWGAHIQFSPGDLMDYDAEVLYGLNTAECVAENFDRYVAARNHLIQGWIKCFDDVWPRAKDPWMQAGLRQSELMSQLLDANCINSGHWKDFDLDAFHKSLAAIADDLTHSRCPVMPIYGAIAATLADPKAGATPEARDQTLRSFLNQVKEALRPARMPRRTRAYLYIAAVDGIRLLPAGTQPPRAAMSDLLALAARRKEVLPYTALKLILDNVDSPKSADEAKTWLGALQTALDAAAGSEVLDANADGTRQALAGAIHALHQQFPELGQEKSGRPWDSARLLTDIHSLPGISRLEEFPQVSGKVVCVLGSGKDADGKFFIQAFEVPLTEGEAAKPLAKLLVNPLPDLVDDSSYPEIGFVYRLVQGSAVDDHNFYVSLRNQGVAVFPRDGGAATRIDKTSGLPSNYTQSLVAFGGDLYIASSEQAGAYLIKWNPKNKSVQVRISSERKQAKSALDNVPGLRIEFMTLDSPRNRLLLGVAQFSNSTGAWSHGGLWQLDLTTNKLKHLLSEAPELNFGHDRGIDHDTLFSATTLWVVQYDLKRDQGRYMSFKPGTLSSSYIRELHLTDKTKRGAGWAEPDTEEAGTRRVVNNWLWMGDPFSRLSADGATTELLDPQLVPDHQPIGPVWTIEPVEGNQLLLGDIRQLYLVKLREEH